MPARFLFTVMGLVFVLSQDVRAADDARDEQSPQSTVAESDESMIPLGGPANEERLRRVIKETVKPKPVERKALPADVEALLAWSPPVNGLAARIEYIWREKTFFVRLKNVSERPLTVPMGDTATKNAAPLFELYVKQGSSLWRQGEMYYRDYFPAPSKPESRDRFVLQSRVHGQKLSDRPWVTLQPGKDCVALVDGSDEKDSGETKIVKIVLRQPDGSDPKRWSGVLETPPRAMELSREQYLALREVVPFPDYYPLFSHDYFEFVNQPISGVECLNGPNQPLIDTLAIYEPPGVCKEFEGRMRVEKVLPMKMLLASVAAPAGSEEAAIFFLESMKDNDYLAVINLHHALWIQSWNYCEGPPDWQKREPPDWLVELCLAILSDNRSVTGLKKTNWEEGTSFKVSSCETEYLVSALGNLKCRKAVPLLIERVKREQKNWDTLYALGEIGDASAIPVLIETLKASLKAIRNTTEYGFEGNFYPAADALSKLKAREAVPVLLQCIEYPEIIGCLEEIGDKRALPALRVIASSKGRIVRDGRPVYPELEGERLFAAKVALARFDGKNEVLRLGEMLADPAMDTEHRYNVVRRLLMRSDPRAIPLFIKVIKTDSDQYIIDIAIQALSELKYKVAVEGLIECFDVNFKTKFLGKEDSPMPYTYRNLIARSLQKITGQPFGADKQQWLQWWREEGSKSAELK